MAPRTKSQNKGGRPAKWNTDTAFALGLALQGRFTTPAQAARKAGIGKSTLFSWLRRGKQAISGSPPWWREWQPSKRIGRSGYDRLETVCLARNDREVLALLFSVIRVRNSKGLIRLKRFGPIRLYGRPSARN